MKRKTLPKARHCSEVEGRLRVGGSAAKESPTPRFPRSRSLPAAALYKVAGAAGASSRAPPPARERADRKPGRRGPQPRGSPGAGSRIWEAGWMRGGVRRPREGTGEAGLGWEGRRRPGRGQRCRGRAQPTAPVSRRQSSAGGVRFS